MKKLIIYRNVKIIIKNNDENNEKKHKKWIDFEKIEYMIRMKNYENNEKNKIINVNKKKLNLLITYKLKNKINSILNWL